MNFFAMILVAVVVSLLVRITVQLATGNLEIARAVSLICTVSLWFAWAKDRRKANEKRD